MARGGRWGHHPGQAPSGRRLFLGPGDRDAALARALGGRMSGGQDIHPLFFSPSVLAVTPNSGSNAGGTPVLITGQNFRPGATVQFGGVAATLVVVNGPTSISCTTPAHGPGAVNVTVTNPDLQTGTLVNGYTYMAPLFAAVGLNVAALSTDLGATYTAHAIPAGDYRAITATASLFCTVGTLGEVATSPDGITWTAQTGPASVDLFGIATDGSIFVAVGQAAAGAVIYTSTDGTSWTNRPVTTTAGDLMNCVTWNGSIFCAIDNHGHSFTSSNGISWARFTDSDLSLNSPISIAWSGTIFVVVSGSAGVGNLDATSSTGQTWTGQSTVPNHVHSSIVWGGAKFAVVNSSATGSNLTDLSADGISWSSSSPMPASGYTAITVGSNVLAAVGPNKAAISSNGGTTWVAGTIPAGSWRAITFRQ